MEWEQLPKHIFVLSAAGKPIFTRHGDEQDMVTTFGLLQAVYSIAQDAGDKIRCICAGKRRIIYFVKESLYFIAVSSTGEPEAILVKQLQFMYEQILLVLTHKVHNVLKNNFSKDLRDLLGSETNRLLHASCRHDITSPTIAYSALHSMLMPYELRMDISNSLKQVVHQSGAVLGLILHEESLISYSLNGANPAFVLDIPDLLLLTHFVGNSTSLKSHDHNWVPICLPTFNSGAYLQGYIASYKLFGGGVVQRPVELTLVLIATSSDPDLFKSMHVANEAFKRYVCQRDIVQKLGVAIGDTQKYLSKYRTNTLCLHFFYLVRPSSSNYYHGNEDGSVAQTSLLPPQCIWSQFEFPLQDEVTQNRIWTIYQRLSCCLRGGTAVPEYTLLDSTNGPKRNNSSSNVETSADTETGNDYPINIMHSKPSSDHSLAYMLLEEGHILVAIANADSELLATFPATMGVLEACNQASILSRSLRNEALSDLFQVDV